MKDSTKEKLLTPVVVVVMLVLSPFIVTLPFIVAYGLLKILFH